jgi:hypothetical protein
MDYVTMAKEADRIAEQICKECSTQRMTGNNISIFYESFYPAVFLEVFHHMITR